MKMLRTGSIIASMLLISGLQAKNYKPHFKADTGSNFHYIKMSAPRSFPHDLCGILGLKAAPGYRDELDEHESVVLIAEHYIQGSEKSRPIPKGETGQVILSARPILAKYDAAGKGKITNTYNHYRIYCEASSGKTQRPIDCKKVVILDKEAMTDKKGNPYHDYFCKGNIFTSGYAKNVDFTPFNMNKSQKETKLESSKK